MKSAIPTTKKATSLPYPMSLVYPFPAVSGSYNSLFFVRVIGVGLGTSVCVNTGGYLDV